MQDFAPSNLPAINVIPPSNLPNRNHEATVSASGNPSVPPRASLPFSPDRPPVIPPRGSSLNRGDKMRRLLEQAAQLRERLPSTGSIQQTFRRSGSQGNRVRFTKSNPSEGGRSSSNRRTFFDDSPFSRHGGGDCLVRSSSLRPPPYDLTIANNNKDNHANDNKTNDNKTNDSRTNDNRTDDSRTNDNANDSNNGTSEIKSTFEASIEKAMRNASLFEKATRNASSSGTSKGKGKARVVRGNPWFWESDDDEDSDDNYYAVSSPMMPMHHIESAEDGNEPRTPVAAMPLSGLHVPKSEPKSEDGVPVTPRQVG
ncbi:hypothetical protein PG997_005187 [Apiospora hydei]|uniref:Uncharacterized protein n=1 Tax=Apiospora hydei TaxID=1337664 RepID=A0ABR1X492_9PEZI